MDECQLAAIIMNALNGMDCGGRIRARFPMGDFDYDVTALAVEFDGRVYRVEVKPAT